MSVKFFRPDNFFSVHEKGGVSGAFVVCFNKATMAKSVTQECEWDARRCRQRSKSVLRSKSKNLCGGHLDNIISYSREFI